MKFLLDECMPRGSKEIFKKLGFNCINSHEANLLGRPDYCYIDFAIKTNRILVTLDRDFSNILIFTPGTYPGVVILRPKPPRTSKSIYILLYKFLKEIKRIDIEKSLVIITPEKIRIRR